MSTRPYSPLSVDILESALILSRGSESVSAVMAGEENRFSRALFDLQRLAETEGLPIAIVGGLAAIRYGYPAATQDIDIVVAREQLALLMQSAGKYGFKVAWEGKSGRHTLMHGDVEINVVPEGGKARNTAHTEIPGPQQLGVSSGLAYANLAGWMELKISSGRQKDRAHVVEVVKKSDAAALQSARHGLALAHPSYGVLFDELLQEALDEQAQEQERKPPE